MSKVRFGSHLFDLGTGTLRCGNASRSLQAQPARLLALLVDRAGQVVTRDQIREALWSETVVSYDQSINFLVRRIRVALGPDAGLLQTVPHLGYRFVGKVVHEDARRLVPWKGIAAVVAVLLALASGFGAGILVRDAPAGRFVYDHLVHPDRCPYIRVLLPNHRDS
ncbi:MAG TPA: winged helix-turn-helix domain-containing protein [Vicinamibacterales bacterium]